MNDAKADELLSGVPLLEAGFPLAGAQRWINEASVMIKKLRRQDLRARFAGQAMQGLLAFEGPYVKGSQHIAAEYACQHADALIAELERAK